MFLKKLLCSKRPNSLVFIIWLTFITLYYFSLFSQTKKNYRPSSIYDLSRNRSCRPNYHRLIVPWNLNDTKQLPFGVFTQVSSPDFIDSASLLAFSLKQNSFSDHQNVEFNVFVPEDRMNGPDLIRLLPLVDAGWRIIRIPWIRVGSTNLNKIWLFHMQRYDRILYLDADHLVLRNYTDVMMESLTDKSSIIAATRNRMPSLYWQFCAGWMIVKPNIQLFHLFCSLVSDRKFTSHLPFWSDQWFFNKALFGSWKEVNPCFSVFAGYSLTDPQGFAAMRSCMYAIHYAGDVIKTNRKTCKNGLQNNFENFPEAFQIWCRKYLEFSAGRIRKKLILRVVEEYPKKISSKNAAFRVIFVKIGTSPNILKINSNDFCITLDTPITQFLLYLEEQEDHMFYKTICIQRGIITQRSMRDIFGDYMMDQNNSKDPNLICLTKQTKSSTDAENSPWEIENTKRSFFNSVLGRILSKLYVTFLGSFVDYKFDNKV